MRVNRKLLRKFGVYPDQFGGRDAGRVLFDIKTLRQLSIGVIETDLRQGVTHYFVSMIVGILE